MADKIPLKLVDNGSGSGSIAEFSSADTVPVSQGGTGGSTQLAAQTGLGLVKQTSPTDGTAGSLLSVGAFGLGSACATLISPNCNSLVQTGFFYLQTPTNAPDTFGWLLNEVLSATYITQAFVSANTGRQYTRSCINGVWSAWAALHSANDPAVMGKNRIINGACQVAQRGSTASGGTVAYGGPDRYNLQASVGAGGQFTQSQGVVYDGPVGKTCVLQTVNTAIVSTATTSYWGGAVHLIEGYNCYDLLGQQVTLSFLFQTNVTGTFSVSLTDSSGSRSYATTFTATAGILTKVTITFPAIPTSAAIPLSPAIGLRVWIGALNMGGTYQATSANAWLSGNYITAPGVTNWGATVGNYIAVTDLQLEAGAVATPFERRPYSVELALCQRYYYVFTGGGVSLSSNGYNSSIFTIPYPVTMRSTPTAAYDVTDGNFVSTTPSGAQWGALVPGVAYVTRTGTCSVGAASLSPQSASFSITGQTFSNAPTQIAMGPSCSIRLTAEL